MSIMKGPQELLMILFTENNYFNIGVLCSDTFMTSKPPKYSQFMNISLTKYQPSIFYVYFLLRK